MQHEHNPIRKVVENGLKQNWQELSIATGFNNYKSKVVAVVKKYSMRTVTLGKVVEFVASYVTALWCTCPLTNSSVQLYHVNIL